MHRGVRDWWVIWLCLPCCASAAEYELSGSYEHFGRRNDPEAVARLQKFVKEHSPPGQPPRMTHQIKAEFEKLHGPLSELLNQNLKPLGEKFDREFKVWVRDNAWCIHTRLPGSDPKTGWEHGTLDGKEFSMTLLTTVVAPRVGWGIAPILSRTRCQTSVCRWSGR